MKSLTERRVIVVLFLLVASFPFGNSPFAAEIEKTKAEANVREQHSRNLSLEEMRSYLDRIYDSLAGNNTVKSQMRAKSGIADLSSHGDAVVPLLDRFLASENIYHRQFAYSLLIGINTPSSRESVVAQFWRAYRSAKDIDKLDSAAASLSYHQATLGIGLPQIEPYWEARFILRKMLSRDTQAYRRICSELESEKNGIGVMAAKCSWETGGGSRGDALLKFLDSDANGETFFTLADELVEIAGSDEWSRFPGIAASKPQIKARLSGVCSERSTSWATFKKAIDYLAVAEEDWFAANWVTLFEMHQKLPNWIDKQSSLARGVSRIGRDKAGVNRLNKKVPEKELNRFLHSIDFFDKHHKENRKK